MSQISSQLYTSQLQQLMQQVGFSSFRTFSQAANVSEKQVRRLRQGEIAQMRLETLVKLSQTLQISLPELLTRFGPSAEVNPTVSQTLGDASALKDLKQEYERLQLQLLHQRQTNWEAFQQSTVQILESLLLQLPTAAYAAQQNPQAPAVKLLPLLRPLDKLLQEWGIAAIAPVGSEVPYDPQQHQLLEGSVQPGELVRVRYTGYHQKDKLLYRAKVSPVMRP